MVPLMKGPTPDDWRRSLYYHYYEYPLLAYACALMREWLPSAIS
jgi:hypothetical protein